MSTHSLSKDDLRTLAQALGMKLSDQELQGLLPQIQQTMARSEALESLDLEGVEPAIYFKVDG